MSNSWKQQNESLSGGNVMKGPGQAAAESARRLLHSGTSYAASDVLDSRQLARKTAKSASERKTCTETDRTVHGSGSQFLGTLSGSYANSRTARRANGVTPIMYTNSSRKRAQSPKSVPRQVQTKRQRES